jgi:hypothetical protein
MLEASSSGLHTISGGAKASPLANSLMITAVASPPWSQLADKMRCCRGFTKLAPNDQPFGPSTPDRAERCWLKSDRPTKFAKSDEAKLKRTMIRR